ncbi:MAG: hypothetical protein U0L74_00850, partial [Paludibacteraceae bacterium]|nr:hypothetical protein [Paludibacteraceae bacterium]
MRKFLFISLFALCGSVFLSMASIRANTMSSDKALNEADSLASVKADMQPSDEEIRDTDTSYYDITVLDSFELRNITFYQIEVKYEKEYVDVAMSFSLPVKSKKEDSELIKNLQKEILRQLLDWETPYCAQLSDIKDLVEGNWSDMVAGSFESEADVSLKEYGWEVSTFKDWIVTRHSASLESKICDLETGLPLNLTIDNFITDYDDKLRKKLFEKVKAELPEIYMESSELTDFMNNGYEDFKISEDFILNEDGVSFIYNGWYDLRVGNSYDLIGATISLDDMEEFVQEEYQYLLKLCKKQKRLEKR